MKTKKTLVALLLSAAVLSAGCSNDDTSWVASYREEQLPAGVYLSMMMDNTAAALSSQEDPAASLKGRQVDGQDAYTWISEKTRSDVAVYYAVEDKAEEYGIQLDENQLAYAQAMAEQHWAQLQEVYEDNGVSQASYQMRLENTLKQSALFFELYGEGGEREVSDEELTAYYNENYARVNFLSFSKTNSEGENDDPDYLAQRRQEAQGYLDRANAGEDFVDLVIEKEEADAAASGGEVHDHNEPGAHELLVTRNSMYDEEFIAGCFDAEPGVPVLFETESNYYVVNRIPLDPEAEDYASTLSSLLLEMKQQEFTDTMTQWGEEIAGQITYNQAALEEYQPQDIDLGA